MEAFTDQKIYAGIDVHKKSWTISIHGEYNTFKTFTQPPCSITLDNYLKKNFPGADYYAVYEAGFCGFSAYYDLNALGINTMVVNAADVPTTDKEKRQKSDPVDSMKLARSLKNGELTAIHVPPHNILNDRSVLRYRSNLVGDQTRMKNRIKGFLFFHGIPIPAEYDNAAWSKSFINWLKTKAEHYLALQELIDQFEFTKSLVTKANKTLLDLAKKEEHKIQFELIKSIPGFGDLSAIHILLEIGDIKRFRTNEKLLSFIGLTPSRHSSGENQRVGPMTPRGNRQIKKYLIEASWTVVRHDPVMMAAFGKLCKRMPKTNAIIRIAKKLVNRIKAVLDKGQPYEINYNL